MKRLVLSLSVAVLTAAIVPCAGQAQQKTAVAPADEYFGRLKMSILGIRNVIHDVTLEIAREPAKAETELGRLNLTEDAMQDWERKYPADPWIPKTLFALERLYDSAGWSDEFNARAKRTMTFLVDHYAKSWYGREAKKELLAGVVGRHVPVPVTAAVDTQAAPPQAAVPIQPNTAAGE